MKESLRQLATGAYQDKVRQYIGEATEQFAKTFGVKPDNVTYEENSFLIASGDLLLRIWKDGGSPNGEIGYSGRLVCRCMRCEKVINLDGIFSDLVGLGEALEWHKDYRSSNLCRECGKLKER